MTGVASSSSWRLPAGTRLRWAVWKDEFVVFHAGSGQTHLLDVCAAEILDRLEAGAATVADLRDLLDRLDDTLPGTEASPLSIERYLEALAEVGLAERAEDQS